MMHYYYYYYYCFRTVNINKESRRDRRRVFVGNKFWKATICCAEKYMNVDKKNHCCCSVACPSINEADIKSEYVYGVETVGR